MHLIKPSQKGQHRGIYFHDFGGFQFTSTYWKGFLLIGHKKGGKKDLHLHYMVTLRDMADQLMFCIYSLAVGRAGSQQQVGQRKWSCLVLPHTSSPVLTPVAQQRK